MKKVKKVISATIIFFFLTGYMSIFPKLARAKIFTTPEDWRIYGFARNRSAFRLHDLKTPLGNSNAGDIVQSENTFWLDVTKYSIVPHVDLTGIFRAIKDVAFDLEDNTRRGKAEEELDDDIDIQDLYLDINLDRYVGEDSLGLRLGRQIVIWGEADGFRFTDLINSLDIRRGFFGEFEELREPLTIGRVLYRNNSFDFNLEAIGVFFDFEETKFSPPGSEFELLLPPPPPSIELATGLSVPFTLNIENRIRRHMWRNTEFGFRIRKIFFGEWDASLLYFHTFNDNPVAKLKNIALDFDPIRGFPSHLTSNLDLVYPRQNVIGVTLNKSLEKGILRFEGAWFVEEFYNAQATATDPVPLSKNNTFKYVIGFDRPTFIPLIATTRTWDISAQFGQVIIQDADEDKLVNAAVGAPFKDVTTLLSLFMTAHYMSDRINPSVLWLYEDNGDHFVTAKFNYRFTDNLLFDIGVNFFEGKPVGPKAGMNLIGTYNNRDQFFFNIIFQFP